MEEYVDLIKDADKGEKVIREEEINTKRKQIQRLEQGVKRVQQGFIMEIFSESEAQKQIKQLKAQIQGLEEQIDKYGTKMNQTNWTF